ncbi:MAG: 3-deoxy-D-manno-octulosonic acid transferase [Alistipes sp.]|nr:3-deoxy-D-manno-octulosonic acid transferase [Alistipes sp.]
MWLYDLIMGLYAALIRLAGLKNKKARLWSEGRKDLFARMQAKIDPSARIVWVHVASLGEFEQGRPLIEAIRESHPEYKILLTFFSPSGYEVRKNYTGADYIFYLPIDTRRNVRRFLDIAHPEIAIFVKYEFWLNMLTELRRRSIRTFVVSAIFRRNSVFFRRYGAPWRKILHTFETLFVQNQESKELLAELGFEQVQVAGDTRFDRVAKIAREAKKVALIERFKAEKQLFIAGSSWGPDEELLIRLANDNPQLKFLIAPHEMDEGRITHLIEATRGGAVRYTQCDETTPIEEQQLLILDTVGLLASAYGYASWGYIGGGFGVGIHNTLEAATFGLPIAFGPNYQKFKEARDLVEIGAAQSITNYEELAAWFAPLRDEAEQLAAASHAARNYTHSNQGATELIIKTIFNR